MAPPSPDCADPREGEKLGRPMSRPFPDSSISWRAIIVGALAGLVLAAGCAKKASPETSSPDAAPADMAAEEEAGDDEAAGGAAEDDSLEALEAELLGFEDGLLGAGVDLPEDVKAARVDLGAQAGTPADAGTPDERRCERICELATNICGLRDRICELADEHEQDPRYVKACDRATQDCERAQGACEDCGE